ncbi:phosphatase PAP2 family protein [Mycobacterium paragordonae]|uniref:Membrane protein n=1 Tax=Mycobacterium paragordonae TaxID=1389713 RepID=A0ABQ1BXE4_9MYCO|nr:phosphatase PAP2 family protein [Mycobacterium paragordonae]AYE93928.1 phosphatase PAP2 family protein [Mycobacterium paragordonae]GFG76829.1 membrane protein [Mycobacterium paragordonae]
MTSPRSVRRLSWSAWLVFAAVALYAALWVGHRQHWGWLHEFDWALLNPAHDIGIKHAGWVRFWVIVSFVLGPIPLRLVTLAAMVFALVRRRVRMGLLLMLCGPLNGFVTLVAKNLAGRPRPTTALVYATETSFPSGHALEAMCSLLALLALGLPMMKSGPARAVAMVLAGLGVFIVGVARVALNVHHPSDVIAGWALGYVYFMLCLWGFRPGSQPRDPTGS